MAGNPKAPWEDAPIVEDKPWEAAPPVGAAPVQASGERATREPPGKVRTGIIAATQGALGDFADELGAGVGQFFVGGTGVKLGKAAQFAPDDSPALRELKRLALDRQAKTPSKYQSLRDALREEATAAREAHPEVYLPLEVGGAALSMAVPGVGVAKGAKLAQTAGKMALLGGVSGLGGSEADLTTGRPEEYARAALDTSVGIGVGGVAGTAAHGIQKGAEKVANKLISGAANRTARAQAKAAQMAADATEAEIASAKSAAGRAAQDAYKQLEHLRELKALRALSPEEKTVFANLSRELGTKAQAKLLPAAAEKEATANALRELMVNKSSAEATRAADLLRPTVKQDALSAFRTWGEPLIGGVGGQYLGEKLFDSPYAGSIAGGTAGLLLGRTKLGKGLLHRIGKPGNQTAIAELQRGLGSFLGGTGKAVGAAEQEIGRAHV